MTLKLVYEYSNNYYKRENDVKIESIWSLKIDLNFIRSDKQLMFNTSEQAFRNHGQN